MIARERELDSAVHSLRFSGGVLISGEAGLGKTLLAASVAARLRQPPVAWIVATAAGRSTPLGALAPLLPPDLATIHPALVAQHVSTRLRELSRSAEHRAPGPPVLVVDDTQLLDAQSAAVLLSLVGARSLRLLGTMRIGSTPSDAVTALWKEGLVDRLDLLGLDRADCRRLLEAQLGGAVASGTVAMLWEISHGNPFYLSELARFGAEQGQLVRASEVWWWVGEAELPPRLSELLLLRIDALDEAAREAVDVLALGEPLPYETLAAVVGEDAILDLDRARILTSDEQDGVLLLRFAHPLLHAVAERRLSATRRRTLSRRLRDAPADHVDLVRRATWEDGAGVTPNADLLLAASDAVLLNDPVAALRLAERAHRAVPSVSAARAMSAAHLELGRPDRARAALSAGRPLVVDLEDRLTYVAEDLSLALWGERDPQAAWAVVERIRTDVVEHPHAALGAEAVVRLFTGGGIEVIDLARRILATGPDPSSRVRALTCLTGALAFADRGAEAIAAGQQLLDALAETRVSATRAGLAYALIAVTGVFYGVEYRLPRPVGRTGRWPGEPEQLEGAVIAAEDGPADDLGWPLLVGLRRHFLGDLVGAAGPLREAYVQQQAGTGLFRSEATAELVIVLAELGQLAEAEAILRDHPPDAVAIIPGLLDWARAAVEAASGHADRATASAIAAARRAAGNGSATMAMNFLCDAARYGDARAAAAVLPTLGLPLDTDLQRVRAADILARAQRHPGPLIAAARVQLDAGFYRHACELAELARAADEPGIHARAIAGVVREVRSRLGELVTTEPGRLTQREHEVTRLAGRGLSDREIAAELVVSIRTVQSHLAAAYRKLGINSRTELADLAH